MKFFFLLNRRTLILCFLILVLTVLIFFRFSGIKNSYKNADTNQNRVLFISSLGYTVDDDYLLTKEIIIPSQFNEEFKKYNSIQKAAGYNLSEYSGFCIQRFTYKIKDTQTLISLLVYNGEIIGGDITPSKFGSSISPIIKSKGTLNEN
ncbi:MAG: DUF4830 domain-containing protein [Oscillospiraceae bacterium]|nr:DUF4830 domain-containing protein [Oscillospiraceae bacterium]